MTRPLCALYAVYYAVCCAILYAIAEAPRCCTEGWMPTPVRHQPPVRPPVRHYVTTDA
ncbi:MAG TPA: hypothetical protein V6C88_04605 [Chroococcidiopsis sp.]